MTNTRNVFEKIRGVHPWLVLACVAVASFVAVPDSQAQELRTHCISVGRLTENPNLVTQGGTTDEMSDDKCDGILGKRAVVYINKTGKAKDVTFTVENHGTCPVTVRRFGGAAAGVVVDEGDESDTTPGETTTSTTLTVRRRRRPAGIVPASPGKLEAYCEVSPGNCDFTINVTDVDNS